MGFPEQRVVTVLEFTRNHRSDALEMLRQTSGAQMLEAGDDRESFLQALQQVQHQTQYHPRPSPSYPSWD
jgi:hypothetical protein